MAKGSRGGQGYGKYKNGGGNSTTSNSNVRNSIGECTNYDELKATFRSKYGQNFRIDNNLASSNFTEIRSAMDGADFVLSEFGATDSTALASFGITKGSGVMSATYDGAICFNQTYFKKTDSIKNLPNNHFHPDNSDAFGYGAHEAGHRLEAYISNKNNNGNSYMNLLDWNDCSLAKVIINKCAGKVKAQYKANGQKVPTIDSLVCKVSKYALKTRSEAFAECISDYAINGNKANALSIEVWNYTKNLLGK